MSKDIVYSGQSFIDKVIECTGDIDNAFKMALANGVSVTDELTVGQSLTTTEITNKSVASYFGEANRPATKLIEPSPLMYELPDGFPLSF
ncbi:MAG: hypothetical protein JST78_09525 [Bacteroidetes bacterium]|nr:hypothetical protein [Bacteroidota bacterium]